MSNSHDPTRRLLSIVCPAFQEEEVLPFFHEELARVLAEVEVRYDVEIIYVDDGSSDGTLGVLKHLRARDPRVRYLSLSRNFGHQAALTAGLAHATGAAVISLDSDLQHPPALIPILLAGWETGHDIVVTVRQDDPTLSVLKRWTSRCFYALMRLLSDVEIRYAAADYRLMSRQAVDSLLQFGEAHRFLRGMVQWLGYSTVEVPYRPASRRAGVSKYTIRRMVRLGMDGLVSFTKVPLRVIFFAGLAVGLAGLVTGAGTVGCALFGADRLTVGLLGLVGVMFALGGSILTAVGIVGEYLGKIHDEVRDRPLYLIKDASPDLAIMAPAVPDRRPARQRRRTDDEARPAA